MGGEDIAIDKDNLDINGCLVGPSGERVCQYANFASDGQSRVSFRQNVGPGTSGSNGNAGQVSQAGKPIDPAAETYKKQIAATRDGPSSKSRTRRDSLEL